MILKINAIKNHSLVHKNNLYNILRSVFSTKAKASKKKKPDIQPDFTPIEGEDEHIFNIYSSISEDHKILPDEAYPNWLWQLENPDKTYGELVQMFVYGKDINNSKMGDYNRFCRLHNRTLIKLNNIRLQKRRKLTLNSHLWDV